MLTYQRRDLITEYINDKKSVTVQELMDEFDASAATIRRDLSALHDEKRILKVFGGAAAIEKGAVTTSEPSVSIKANLNTEEKERISSYAAMLINDDDFVFIDSGTTTLELIKHIENTKAVFVTNGIVHAKMLVEKGLKTTIIGGRCRQSTEAVVGPECIEAIGRYHFTKAFLGTNGVSVDAGYTTPDPDEALVKEQAVKHAYVPYMLADHTKFGRVSSVSFAPLSACCIITDRDVGANYLDKTIIKIVE